MTLTGTKKKHTKHWGQQCYPQLFGYLLGVDPVQGSQGIQSIIQLYSQRLNYFSSYSLNVDQYQTQICPVRLRLQLNPKAESDNHNGQVSTLNIHLGP